MKKYLPDYQKLEKYAESVVHDKIGLPLKYQPKSLIMEIDRRALQIETMLNEHPLAASYGTETPSVSRKEAALYERAVAIASDQKLYYQFVSEAVREARNEIERKYSDC